MIGRAALGIWMEIGAEGLEDFNAWYRRQHLPERLSVPGFLRGRRYEHGGEGPRYFTLYETSDASVLTSDAYLERLDHPTDWTRRALPRITRMVRNAYRALGGSSGDAATRDLVTVRVQPHSGRGPYVKRWLEEQAASALAGVDGVVGWAVYESDTSGTGVVTEERKIMGGEVVAAPPFLVLCETRDADTVPRVQEFWRSWATRIAADATTDAYTLLYGLAWLGG
jgi:hypothetical protein